MVSEPDETEGLAALCGCRWTPGIDLPTTECDNHANDDSLAHLAPTEVSR